jgi:hypothetical protein
LNALRSSYENEAELASHLKQIESKRISIAEHLETHIRSTRRELQKLNHEEEGLVEAVTSATRSGDTPKTLRWIEAQITKIQERKQEAETRLAELERERAQLDSTHAEPNRTKTKLGKVFEQITTAEPIRQRALFREIFKKVEVSKDGKTRIVWSIPKDVTGGGNGFSPNLNGGRRGMLLEPRVVVREYPAGWARTKVDLSELAKLRFEKRWSLNDLSRHYGIGRTTLFRLLRRISTRHEPRPRRDAPSQPL